MGGRRAVGSPTTLCDCTLRRGPSSVKQQFEVGKGSDEPQPETSSALVRVDMGNLGARAEKDSETLPGNRALSTPAAVRADSSLPSRGSKSSGPPPDRRRSGRHLLPSDQCPGPNNPDYYLRALVPFRKHGLTVRPRNLAALNAPGPQRSNGGQCRRMCPRRQRPRQSDYACSGSACRPEPG